MRQLQHLSLLLAVSCVFTQASESESLKRPRRQFPGDWVPLTQPCPTCRPLTDPADLRPSLEDIGLVPPRPPISSRQIHGSTNFFPQNSPFQQQHTAFQPQRQYQDFQFNQFPQTQFFGQQQQSPFLPQTYLNNPQLLLNDNPQLLTLFNNPQLSLNPQKEQQSFQFNESGEKKQEIDLLRFKPDLQKSSTKPPQNIRLDQQKAAPPLTRLELPHNGPPNHFFRQGSPQQQQQQQQLSSLSQFQQFPNRHQMEQQSLLQVNPNDHFLSSQHFNNNNNSDIQIPGLEKEEIQLLYVPVETLRQRGQLQGHTIDEPKQPFLNNQAFQQLIQQPSGGHFITQAPSSPPTQFSSQSSVTLPPALTQSLPLREPPQQFATERPQGPPTTEKVVTIQPRPVSTVRQQSERFTTRQPSRPTETRTPSPLLNSSPFLSNDHFTQVTQNLRNEVTSNFLPSSPAPPQQNFAQRQPTQDVPQRHRFGSPVEAITSAPIASTTLQPHQPPLSVYMIPIGGDDDIKVSDVLRALKGADEIAVLDSFSPGNPKVFVGPANLNAPRGIGKFELPYLSNLEANRVERKIDLPFFVAPLNFNPPEGYSKIPFPAPHVGSVVVATDVNLRSSFTERVTTQDHFQDQEQLNSIEPEVTTALPETTLTTTIRSRGRRPNQYRTGGRKPVTNARQRVTPRPLDEDTTQPINEQRESTNEYLREQQEERKRPIPRRQRLRTTTEPISETVVTEATALEETSAPEQDDSIPDVDSQQIEVDTPFQGGRQSLDFARRPEPPIQQLTQPLHPPVDFRQPLPFDQRQRLADFRPPPPTEDFNPPPPPTAFSRRPQRPNQFEEAPIEDYRHPQQQFRQPQFEPVAQNHEPQGIFEVPPPPSTRQEFPSVETDGDSGFQQQQISQEAFTTEQPKITTQFYDTQPTAAQTAGITEQEVSTEPPSIRRTTTPSTTTTEETKDVEEIEKSVDTPKRSRYSSLNASGVKAYPETGSGKVRSHVRSRQRNPSRTTSTTTTTSDAEEPIFVDPTGPADETISSPSTENTRAPSKYISHFNRSRKPLRPTTSKPDTTTSSQPSSTRSYTVRPLRRTTNRVSTKRVRKPTTPSSVDGEEESPDATYTGKRTRPNFGPSAASNEVYDEQPSAPAAKPKARKPYYKNRNVEIIEDHTTSQSPSTRTYQQRKDVEFDEPRIEESRAEEVSNWENGGDVSESRLTTLVPSAPEDSDERRKVTTEDRKKAADPESHKKGRRRLRVRVQKRPQDNFETAESQSHGTVNNVLVPPHPDKQSPDLYQFSQSGEFDFESSGKFIGTQHKGHVRNITADILENTSTFSSPGTDSEVHQVTIAIEATTFTPETSEPSTTEEALSTQSSTTDLRNQTAEATTFRPDTTRYTSSEYSTTTTEAVDTTTSDDASTSSTTTEIITTTTLAQPDIKKQLKVVKTSMTTQVSHETEICYKGKCIKTNSDNPDKALRQLVESANLEERNART